MRFLIDMNLSPDWVPVLKGAGHEAMHWSKVGSHSAPDSEIMEFARADGRVVFTNDLDFGALLAYSSAARPSVVQLREQNLDPATQGGVVVAGIAACIASLKAGALVTIDLRRTKATILPLRRPLPRDVGEGG